MGKKRQTLGFKVRPKKSKKKKCKSNKKGKSKYIEADKLQLGLEEICSQLPDIGLVKYLDL